MTMGKGRAPIKKKNGWIGWTVESVTVHNVYSSDLLRTGPSTLIADLLAEHGLKADATAYLTGAAGFILLAWAPKFGDVLGDTTVQGVLCCRTGIGQARVLFPVKFTRVRQEVSDDIHWRTVADWKVGQELVYTSDYATWIER
jgi:hypothetical protein